MADVATILAMVPVGLGMAASIAYIINGWRKNVRDEKKDRKADINDVKDAIRDIRDRLEADRRERQERDRIVDGRLVDICERLARLEGKIDGSAGQGAAGRSPKGSAA